MLFAAPEVVPFTLRLATEASCKNNFLPNDNLRQAPPKHTSASQSKMEFRTFKFAGGSLKLWIEYLQSAEFCGLGEERKEGVR